MQSGTLKTIVNKKSPLPGTFFILIDLVWLYTYVVSRVVNYVIIGNTPVFPMMKTRAFIQVNQ